MVRAVIFDFYGVWVPDVLGGYVESEQDPSLKQLLANEVAAYYQGRNDLEHIAGTLKFKCNRFDVDVNKMTLRETDIGAELVTFLRNLHGHFLKLGVVANLGVMENELLKNFNAHQQLFEVIASPLSLNLFLPLLSEEFFAAALQTLGEPPKSCLAISGNAEYRQFAESIGMQSLPFEGLPKLEQAINNILLSDTPGVAPS